MDFTRYGNQKKKRTDNLVFTILINKSEEKNSIKNPDERDQEEINLYKPEKIQSIEVLRIVSISDPMANMSLSSIPKFTMEKITFLPLFTNYLFIAKSSISQLLIVSLPLSPYQVLTSMLILELAQLVLNIYCQFCLKSFISPLVILQRLVQNLGFISIIILFLALKARIDLGMGSRSATLDEVLKMMIVVVVSIEYFFSIFMIIFIAWKTWSIKKKISKEGKDGFEGSEGDPKG